MIADTIDPTELTDRQLRERIAWWERQAAASVTGPGWVLACEVLGVYADEAARRVEASRDPAAWEWVPF